MAVLETDRTYVPISVVIPCYFCSKTIERAVDSIANQEWLPRETILIEDGSPDNGATLTILRKIKEKYAPLFSINTIIFEKNKGVSSARNAGWNAATQPYIAFLDSDDSWHPQKLRCQYHYLQHHPDVSLLGSRYAAFYKKKQANNTGNFHSFNEKILSTRRLLFANQFATSSMIVKSNVPFRFCDGKQYSEDYLLWLEIISAGYMVVELDMPFVFFHKEFYGASGLSSNMWALQKEELKNYWELYQKKSIGLIDLLIFMPISMIRYTRRLLLNLLRTT